MAISMPSNPWNNASKISGEKSLLRTVINVMRKRLADSSSDEENEDSSSDEENEDLNIEADRNDDTKESFVSGNLISSELSISSFSDTIKVDKRALAKEQPDSGQVQVGAVGDIEREKKIQELREAKQRAEEAATEEGLKRRRAESAAVSAAAAAAISMADAKAEAAAAQRKAALGVAAALASANEVAKKLQASERRAQALSDAWGETEDRNHKQTEKNAHEEAKRREAVENRLQKSSEELIKLKEHTSMLVEERDQATQKAKDAEKAASAAVRSATAASVAAAAATKALSDVESTDFDDNQIITRLHRCEDELIIRGLISHQKRDVLKQEAHHSVKEESGRNVCEEDILHHRGLAKMREDEGLIGESDYRGKVKKYEISQNQFVEDGGGEDDDDKSYSEDCHERLIEELETAETYGTHSAWPTIRFLSTQTGVCACCAFLLLIGCIGIIFLLGSWSRAAKHNTPGDMPAMAKFQLINKPLPGNDTKAGGNDSSTRLIRGRIRHETKVSLLRLNTRQ